MIKTFFSALALVLFATTMMAQSGLTCEDPIPVNENYTGSVDGPCTLWYSAWTYDLPLNVHFIPDDPNSAWGPEVEVDFTCVPGVYADPKLDSLINLVEDYDVSFPIEFLCDFVTKDGKVEWDLSVNKNYREQLAEFGIPYNIQAFIKVTYFESGRITLKPDTLFKNCMENGEYLKLGDTIDIEANDSESFFVLPYVDWQNDSIQFTWTGEQPAQVYVAVQECDFMPSVSSPYVWDSFETSADAPYKLYTEQMKQAIKDNIGAGLFYGKVLSSTPGQLVVEHIPMGQVEGGAVLMEYGESYTIVANDPNALYCFPKSWSATQFISDSKSKSVMYLSGTHEFTISENDANVLAAYLFRENAAGSDLCLSTTELTDLYASINDYVYVRFATAKTTTITPHMWDASDCADKSTQLISGKQVVVPARSSSVVYRLRYDDWKGGDITIAWTGSSPLPVYIADTCFHYLSSSDERVVRYSQVARRSSIKISTESINSWEPRVDADGFLYVCFNPTSKGNVTFISDKPSTPDPIYTTISDTLCYGESYTWNGQTYSATGDYQQTLVAANGADSIVTLKLTILPEVPATTEKAEIIAGETYTWNGKEYTEAGEYTITLQDENGCDYQATLILNVLPPLSPCLQASVKLNVGDELKVNLASAFTVYAIDYNAWMQQAVTLVWTGVEPLHTFVAETCEFALAPYNRYVHAYVPVPAQGDWVLDMNALAPYVDEDGYLYVRFLTEFEGTLKVW